MLSSEQTHSNLGLDWSRDALTTLVFDAEGEKCK